MTLLSAPDNSCLLLLDLTKRQAETLPRNPREKLERTVGVLERIAKIIRVPRFLAVPTSVAGSELVANFGQPIFEWLDGGSPWADNDLTKAIADKNRSRLFLAGFWLEDTVTFSALGALADGYDVHVMLDVSVARREDTREATIERLVQAGVVPTTAVQLVSEWAATTEDADTRNQLHKIISGHLS